MNKVEKWEGEEYCQKPQRTGDGKGKERGGVRRVVEWERAEGETKDARLQAFLLW